MNEFEEKKIVIKPWGKEIWFALVLGKYMGKILEIEPGQQVSLHYHNSKEETMYLFSGKVELWGIRLDGKEYLIKTVEAGSYIHVLPGTAHSMKSVGEIQAIFFEVSTPHPDDSVRIKDFYSEEQRARIETTYVHLNNIADSIKEKKE